MLHHSSRSQQLMYGDGTTAAYKTAEQMCSAAVILGAIVGHHNACIVMFDRLATVVVLGLVLKHSKCCFQCCRITITAATIMSAAQQVLSCRRHAQQVPFSLRVYAWLA
eukprot:GHUV01014472.1.p2 GENE.GHUV01014472.1~~GHUV01014472.1.p2  ORF type:complete len:109 (+),score=34.92 GHUV01014472.1:598-924(+)